MEKQTQYNLAHLYNFDQDYKEEQDYEEKQDYKEKQDYNQSFFILFTFLLSLSRPLNRVLVFFQLHLYLQ